ncbi:hypothetical protein Tco_1186757, partial [Tanacetum coccineum]
MKESKAYKTYLCYATGVIPPKMARKFKKASPFKKDRIVIRETPVETKTKRKEKVDVTRGKGIELLSEVALTEEAQMKEVRKKSLRDFHMTHPSGSGMVAEKPSRVEKITPTIISEGTGDKPGVPNVTKDDSTESGSESWGNDDDNRNNEQESSNEGGERENEKQEKEVKDNDKEEDEFVHTPSHTDDKDDDNLESKSNDVNEGDEEKGMDDTTNQFDDDMDSRLNEPTQTDKEKTEVPVTSSSCSSDMASKVLNFLDIPHADAKIVSPLDVHVHHEVPSN